MLNLEEMLQIVPFLVPFPDADDVEIITKDKVIRVLPQLTLNR